MAFEIIASLSMLALLIYHFRRLKETKRPKLEKTNPWWSYWFGSKEEIEELKKKDKEIYRKNCIKYCFIYVFPVFFVAITIIAIIFSREIGVYLFVASIIYSVFSITYEKWKLE